MTEAEMETKTRNPIQTLYNGDGTEENKPLRSLLFRLRFTITGFVCMEFRASVSASVASD